MSDKIKLKNSKILSSVYTGIQVDFDNAWKIAYSISIAIALFSLLVPLFSLISVSFLVLIWFFIQKTDGIDEKKVEKLRYWMFLITLLSIEIIFLSLGFDTLAIEILLFIIFYAIASISLNLSTGIVGVLNFGVIAQIAVGSVTFSILTVNSHFPIIIAIFFAMLASAIFSAIIAMLTLRLRDDYFAIISITLGEIFRQFLKTEPSLRGPIITEGKAPTTPGIIGVPLPFKEFYSSYLTNIFGFEIKYRFILSIVGMFLLVFAYLISEKINKSPYGRVLRSIREDDLVSSSYGKNVLKYKVEVMAVSGAVAGLGGVMLSWIFISIFPENFLPLVTFYIWTVYIIGGRGNNKGMIVGSIAFVLLERMSLFFDDPDTLFISSMNKLVKFFNPNAPSIAIAYFQLMIVGLVLILFIRYSPRGILPEEAFRPMIGGIKLPPPGSQSTSQKGLSDTDENITGEN